MAPDIRWHAHDCAAGITVAVTPPASHFDPQRKGGHVRTLILETGKHGDRRKAPRPLQGPPGKGGAQADTHQARSPRARPRPVRRGLGRRLLSPLHLPPGTPAPPGALAGAPDAGPSRLAPSRAPRLADHFLLEPSGDLGEKRLLPPRPGPVQVALSLNLAEVAPSDPCLPEPSQPHVWTNARPPLVLPGLDLRPPPLCHEGWGVRGGGPHPQAPPHLERDKGHAGNEEE